MNIIHVARIYPKGRPKYLFLKKKTQSIAGKRLTAKELRLSKRFEMPRRGGKMSFFNSSIADFAIHSLQEMKLV